jgi:hypothetical protein
VNISSDMCLYALRPLLQRKGLKYLRIDAQGVVAADVEVALLVAQPLHLEQRRLFQTQFSSCAVRGCEHWSAAALNSVLAALPMHVNTLSLQKQLQQPQELAALGSVGIPDAIQTLTLEHINAFMRFGEHSL